MEKKNKLIIRDDLPKGALRLLDSGSNEGYPISYDSMKLLEVGYGYTKWEIEVSDNTKNPYGMIHGGVLFMISDNCAGATAATLGHKSVTLNSSINYIKSAKKGKVYATPKVVHNGKSTLVIEVTVVDEDGDVVSTSNFTMFSLGNIDTYKGDEK